MTMKTAMTIRSSMLTALLWGCSVGAGFAAEATPWFNFKFEHLSNMENESLVAAPLLPESRPQLQFSQYDATWTYPWESKHVNIDVGVTLRHLSGFRAASSPGGAGYFQQTFPLLHASALFALPLKGLTAGIEGSHVNVRHTQAMDYRAKVQYEWREGFGLQGGWKHQQFNLEAGNDAGTDFQHTGPYLDFYLNF